MGIPPRLNGNMVPLPPKHTGICLTCGREVNAFILEKNNSGEIINTCPHCGTEDNGSNFIIIEDNQR